jgi:hypothetical protein
MSYYPAVPRYIEDSYANIPAASSVTPGSIFRVSDGGGVRFMSDGTNWIILGTQPYQPVELVQDKTVGNTTTETSLLSLLSPPMTIPNGMLTSGRVFRFTAGGGIDHAATAGDTLSFRMYLDGVNPGGLVFTMDATLRTGREWLAEGIIEIRSTPTAVLAGDYTQMLHMESVNAVGTSQPDVKMAGNAGSGTSAIAIGTGARSFDFTAQWSVAKASNIVRCKYWSLEVVK